MIRLAYLQIIEKYLVQLIVIVLAGMHQNVIRMFVQFSNHTTHLDEFWPRANDRHNLKHLIFPE